MGNSLCLGIQGEVTDTFLDGLGFCVPDLLLLLIDVSAVNTLGGKIIFTEVVGSVVELTVPAAISWNMTPSMAYIALWDLLEALEEFYKLAAGSLADIAELVDNLGLLVDDSVDGSVTVCRGSALEVGLGELSCGLGGLLVGLGLSEGLLGLSEVVVGRLKVLSDPVELSLLVVELGLGVLLDLGVRAVLDKGEKCGNFLDGESLCALHILELDVARFKPCMEVLLDHLEGCGVAYRLLCIDSTLVLATTTAARIWLWVLHVRRLE